MGYTTVFEGAFYFDRQLTEEEAKDLIIFSMKKHGTDLTHGYNYPSYPGYNCDWVPTHNRWGLVWNGTEKFYDYIPWLNHLRQRFFQSWGVKLNGIVSFRGEDFHDIGQITMRDNYPEVYRGGFQHITTTSSEGVRHAAKH